MVFHLEIVPFLFGTVLVSALAIYGFTIRHLRGVEVFSLMMVAIAFWLITSSLDMSASTVEAKLFWSKLKYLGTTATAVLWLILSLILTDNERYITRRLQFVAWGWAAAVVIVVWTNDWHGLYWEDFFVDPGSIESGTVHGPLFNLYAIPSASVVPITAVLYLRHLVAGQPFYRTRSTLLLVAGSLPLLGWGLAVSGNPLMQGVDQVPLMMVISAVVYSIAIFRYQMLDVLRLAQGLVIENLNAGVLVVDHKRKILGANPYVLEQFPEVDVEKMLDVCMPGIGSQHFEDGNEIEYQHRENDRWFLIRATVLSDPRVGDLGFALIFLDITERKHAESVLRESVAARTQFFANMSHELRTPLHGISGLLELLKNSELSARQGHYVAEADASARLLSSLINDVLDISRIESGQLSFEAEAFELSQVFDQVGAAVAVVAEGKGLELTLDQPELDCYLLGDSLRVTQVLTNLAGNAVKFTHQGQVTVVAAVSSEDESSIELEFRVKDTGIGISKGQKEILFDAFSQADASMSRRYGGTGLGLNIAQQLVQRMGGSISVNSELSEGSEFVFCLSFPKGGVLTDDIDSELPVESMQARILVVDDVAVNQIIVKDLLEPYGVSVEVASSGEQALALVGEQQFDLVFMDVQMPDMDGLEVTRRIRRSENPELPIIAMTASAFDEDRQNAITAGVSDYIVKPFHAEDLHAVINRWIGPSAVQTASATPDLQGLKQRFLTDLRVDLKSLQSTETDTTTLTEFLHRTKGSAGMLGLNELSQLAESLETSADSVSASNVYQRINDLLSKLT